MNSCAALVCLLLLAAASGCGPLETRGPMKAPHPHLQLHIAGTGMAHMRTYVESKRGPFKIGMCPENGTGASQRISFLRADTIDGLFPLGIDDSLGRLDTTAIDRNQTLVFSVQIVENRWMKPQKKPLHTPDFRVELLADGEVAQSVRVPLRKPSAPTATPADSTATLVLMTKDLPR